MGTGGSLLRHHHDEDDVMGADCDSNSQGVVKRIPIEVKPRPKLGLRSVGSFGRKPKGGSLRSALSVDLDSPEVEKIRREFEMYRMQKENELANLQKKEHKLETENKRLRGELLALQKTGSKLRHERDQALEAEHQALTRASAFEQDRDKVQRQFKIFRETKECEIQNLLRAKRDIESKLTKISHGLLAEDSETVSRVGMDSLIGGGNPGEWWNALESEPSIGSTTQLHQTNFRGPEFAASMMEIDGPFINVNKDDWNAAAASLAQVVPTLTESVVSNIIRIYISATGDMQHYVDLLIKEYNESLKQLCTAEGRFLILLHMPCDEPNLKLTSHQAEKQFSSRSKQMEQASVFLSFLGEHINRVIERELLAGHLNNPGSKPAVFCYEPSNSNQERDPDVVDWKDRIRSSGNVKIIDNFTNVKQGVERVYAELERIVKIELGVEVNGGKLDSDSGYQEMEGPEQLCGGSLWDPLHDYEQAEALAYAVKSSCELGFEKYYERLNAHVCAPGPLSPLLISGSSGSGRSLLLAKWLELQQQKSLGSLVLYHFVGSSSSCSADPVLMIRRLTYQLMQHVNSPPALTCDPVRLVDEFPRWLEKVSSKTPGGVILVLDSIDRFQQGEAQLQWLLDPLPVDARVIVSVHQDSCPQSWRSWPTLHLEPLSNKNVKELLRAELASMDTAIHPDQESRILTHCRTPDTCCPLYVMVLAADIARCEAAAVDRRLDLLLAASDCTQLYKLLSEQIQMDHEGTDNRGMLKKILKLVYASRNGVSETELVQLIPSLTWNFWTSIYDELTDHYIITLRSGLVILAHQQVAAAVKEKYFANSESKGLDATRQMMTQHFSKFLRPGVLTYREADELPWLNKQTGNKEHLYENILNLCIFVKLYGRGRGGELISYWQYLDFDKKAMANSYFAATKKMEEYVGEYDGLITLPKIADMYEALGRFYRDLGLLNEAAMPLQRALEVRETALDPDHPSIAHSLHQYAGLHAQWGKFSTAETLYKQALEIYENAFGRDHLLVAKELDSLAVLYQKQEKHELVEPLHKRAMMIRKQSKAQQLNSGQLRGADPLRRRALQLEELAMGPDSAGLARTLNEIGVLYYLQNNTETAESFFKRSLEMREYVLDPDHPDIAQTLNNLAALYTDKKMYDKAEPLYEKALFIRQKHYPQEHQSVASIVKNLALLYKKQGKLDKAVPYYKQTVEIRQSSFGLSHPSVATALVNLAVIYCQIGNHSLAIPLYERALKIYEDSFGNNHLRVAETLKNMAVLKYDQGEYETAARLYKRATEIKDNDSGYPGKGSSRRSSSGENSTIKNITSTQPAYAYSSQES